ncbi:MAG: replication initiation protein [Bacteroidota bacterium]
MYKLIRLHIGQNRTTFVYSIEELRKLLQVDKDKYTNLNDFKKRVLEPVKVELNQINGLPINFDYESCGNKQRNVTHLQFTIHTAFKLSQSEKQEFIDATLINPKLVNIKLEEILIKNYNFRENHRNIILSDKEKMNKFATLHIEFENNLHPKVKNKTAYILACLDMIIKKNTSNRSLS